MRFFCDTDRAAASVLLLAASTAWGTPAAHISARIQECIETPSDRLDDWLSMALVHGIVETRQIEGIHSFVVTYRDPPLGGGYYNRSAEERQHRQILTSMLPQAAFIPLPELLDTLIVAIAIYKEQGWLIIAGERDVLFVPNVLHVIPPFKGAVLLLPKSK